MNNKRSAHNRVDLYPLSKLNYGSTNGILKYSATDFARFLGLSTFNPFNVVPNPLSFFGVVVICNLNQCRR